jgi:hypothetical protein
VAVSINSIDLITEPTFAEITSETVTTEIRAQLDAAVAAIPRTHRWDPSRDRVFELKKQHLCASETGPLQKASRLLKSQLRQRTDK